jgi:hypothetical protein
VNRLEAVVALLCSLDDWVPTPPTSTGLLVERSAVRGEARTAWAPCDRCSGRGTAGVLRPFRNGVRVWAACRACEGEGRIRVDPMVEGSPPRSPERDRRRLDRELKRLEWAQAHREGRIEPDESESWERSRLWLERHGSYRELRILLARLPSEDRLALQRVYGPDRHLRRVGPGLQGWADRLVEMLAEAMPDVIRVPLPAERDAKQSTWRGRSQRHEAERAKRDERFRRTAAEHGLVEAAASFGLSVRHARRLLKQPPNQAGNLQGISGAGL